MSFGNLFPQKIFFSSIFHLEFKEKLLKNEIMAICAFIAQIKNHNNFLIDFDKYFIRPIQALHQNIVSIVNSLTPVLKLHIFWIELIKKNYEFS